MNKTQRRILKIKLCSLSYTCAWLPWDSSHTVFLPFSIPPKELLPSGIPPDRDYSRNGILLYIMTKPIKTPLENTAT